MRTSTKSTDVYPIREQFRCGQDLRDRLNEHIALLNKLETSKPKKDRVFHSKSKWIRELIARELDALSTPTT